MPNFKKSSGFKMHGTQLYGKSPFTKPKKRRDYLDTGLKSGGGFFNRLKKEGVGSAALNTAPARYVRTLGHGLYHGIKDSFTKSKKSKK